MRGAEERPLAAKRRSTGCLPVAVCLRLWVRLLWPLLAPAGGEGVWPRASSYIPSCPPVVTSSGLPPVGQAAARNVGRFRRNPSGPRGHIWLRERASRHTETRARAHSAGRVARFARLRVAKYGEEARVKVATGRTSPCMERDGGHRHHNHEQLL